VALPMLALKPLKYGKRCCKRLITRSARASVKSPRQALIKRPYNGKEQK